MNGYNFEAARAIHIAMVDYQSGDFDTLGITPDDFALVASNEPWHATERRRVIATLDAIMHGTTDAMGLDRLTLPAEFVAGAVQLNVAPVNHRVACFWLASAHMAGARAADLAHKSLEGGDVEPATATQLFALISQAYDPSKTSEYRQKWLGKMTKAINQQQVGRKPSKADL